MTAIIITHAEAKEIAALALAVQKRQDLNFQAEWDGNAIAKVAVEAIHGTQTGCED